MRKARWIRKTHLFRADEYLCPVCGPVFAKPCAVCPACHSPMTGAKADPSWADEAEELSALLDEDW